MSDNNNKTGKSANTIPGYKIRKKLGAGAMATVYLAREAKLDRDVALKVMSRRFLNDPSFADRFLREARIVASISHRNIVTVFDVGSHNGFHYMAMELLPGGNLSAKLKKGIPLREAIGYVMDIAEGLHYAASKNFIHRDIKPDNIMFGEDGRAVITDFGIARNTSSESNMTMVGSIIGTPQYMSPEQAGAKALDHRTDLYSLGIILFQILTGAPPFKGDSAIATGVMHITQPIPLLPDEFEAFQEVIDVALAKNPDERFQSGQEFIDVLMEIDLEPFEEYETLIELITPEDVEAMWATQENFIGSETVYPADYSMELPIERSMGAGTYASDYYQAEPKSRLPIILSAMIFLLVLLALGAHVYYVNVLGKQTGFTASERFGAFTGSVLQGVLPQGDAVAGLSAEQRNALNAMDRAMRDGRLFVPSFDCAELYFLELVEISPDSEIVKSKAKALLKTALERTIRLLNSNEIDKAAELIADAERMLPYIKDEALLARHRQLASSVMIRLQ